MAYTPTPNFAFLNIFQWERPEFPNPKLNAPIQEDATVFILNAPPRDKDAIITGNFLMNVKNNAGYTENCYVPSGTLAYDAQTANFTVGEIIEGATSGARAIVAADTDDGTTGTLTLASVVGTFQNDEVIAGDAGGSADVNGTLTNSMSTDGLTASNVVRGVRLNGLDFFTTNTTLRAAHEVNAPVRCVISPVYNQIVFDWIRGQSNLGSGGNLLVIGDGSASNNTIAAKDATGVREFLRRNDTSDKAEFSDDGSSWTPLGQSGNHGTTANIKDHVDVAASASDTPVDGDLFVYDTTNKWENQPIGTALGATATEITQLSGTTNIAEADAFFGATDMTGAEAELLTGGGDASALHFHDDAVNSALTQRRSYSVRDANLTGSVTNRGDDIASVLTATTNNTIACAQITSNAYDLYAGGGSLHNKNPNFRVNVTYLFNTNQDGFVGCVNNAFVGTSLEDSVLILDHFGFIIEDGTLYISVADGTTQTKQDISGTFADVTSGYMYRAEFDGTTATFWVNNTLAGTPITINVPDSSLNAFRACVIADVSASQRELRIDNTGLFTYDE